MGKQWDISMTQQVHQVDHVDQIGTQGMVGAFLWIALMIAAMGTVLIIGG